MEASSPLAALHRPVPVPSWGGSRDIFRSRPHAHPFSNATSNPTSMSLREQLHRNPVDYFNAKDLRGSSPAASLAADISQNFRLDTDSSPQFPTPRRALFTADMMGVLENRGQVTTPPLPTSSPANRLTELMEVSPLPHKAPFSTQIEVTSPTPLSTPAEDEDMLLDSPAPITRQASLEPPKMSEFVPPNLKLILPTMLTLPCRRKIAAPRRPSLTRMKGITTSAVPTRVPSADQLPVFRFGAESPFTASSSSLSLDMCFDSVSPPQERERRPHSATTPSAPIPLGLRSRPQFNLGSKHGSPINNQARRQSNPFLRNRKQFRRSLSMYEHPGDIMKPKKETEETTATALQAVMDIEEPQDPCLPHFLLDDPTDTIPRISKETLLDVLDGRYMDKFDQKMVIDCRFEYEYEGGHIDGAVNYNDKELLTSQLFTTPMSGRTLLVFHCEYSAHRAPLMARHVRSQDRTTNAEFYPKLTYPEVYILDGGYSGFFSEHRSRCYPPEYVEMSDAKHQRTCEREMGRLKQRKGFARAQTFAFGQREHCVDDSPTGPTRPSSRHAPRTLPLLGASPILGDRSHARRMASY